MLMPGKKKSGKSIVVVLFCFYFLSIGIFPRKPLYGYGGKSLFLIMCIYKPFFDNGSGERLLAYLDFHTVAEF